MSDSESGHPQSISNEERAWHVILAVCLLGYGGIGLYVDDLYIPGKYGRGAHLHGTAAWIMYGAFLCAATNLLSILVDHLDSGDAARRYHIFARVTQGAAWSLFLGSLGLGIFTSRPSARPSPALTVAHRVYDADQLNVQPWPIFQVPPQYPPELKAQGITGKCVVVFTVRADGSTGQASWDSTTDMRFVDPSVAAILQWQFHPGEINGVPVDSRCKVPFGYSLDPDKLGQQYPRE